MNKKANFTPVIGQKALKSRIKVKNARKQIRIKRGIKINCKTICYEFRAALINFFKYYYKIKEVSYGCS